MRTNSGRGFKSAFLRPPGFRACFRAATPLLRLRQGWGVLWGRGRCAVSLVASWGAGGCCGVWCGGVRGFPVGRPGRGRAGGGVRPRGGALRGGRLRGRRGCGGRVGRRRGGRGVAPRRVRRLPSRRAAGGAGCPVARGGFCRRVAAVARGGRRAGGCGAGGALAFGRRRGARWRSRLRVGGVPGGPCPAVCRPVAGPLSVGRVPGGGSGSWLAVALAAGAGLPVVVFLPAGVAPPAWPGGSWAPAASSGVWAAALRWSPSALAGVLPGFGGGAPFPGCGGFPPH